MPHIAAPWNRQKPGIRHAVPNAYDALRGRVKNGLEQVYVPLKLVDVSVTLSITVISPRTGSQGRRAGGGGGVDDAV